VVARGVLASNPALHRRKIVFSAHVIVLLHRTSAHYGSLHVGQTIVFCGLSGARILPELTDDKNRSSVPQGPELTDDKNRSSVPQGPELTDDENRSSVPQGPGVDRRPKPIVCPTRLLRFIPRRRLHPAVMAAVREVHH
jgi:hypothetical protein